MIASMSAGQPSRCTTTIAFVRGVTRARMDSGSRQSVAGSMSAKTGTAPLTSAQVAEAAMVYGETTTSSPGPQPAAWIAA